MVPSILYSNVRTSSSPVEDAEIIIIIINTIVSLQSTHL